jgi:glycopeptide antibiotics resistance protein
LQRLLHTGCVLGFLLVLAADLVLELMPGIVMDAGPKLFFAAAFALLWTLSCLPLRSPGNRRRWLTVLMFYYIWLLLNVLFFDGAFGRDGLHPTYSPGELWELFRAEAVTDGVSMVPLRTIRNYLRAYELGNISRELLVLNLGGNLAAFAPMGFFLPSLYRAQRNPIVFALTVGVSIAAVEFVQAMIGCGSADIDDFILNFAGAAVLWILLWFPTRWLHRSLESRKR